MDSLTDASRESRMMQRVDQAVDLHRSTALRTGVFLLSAVVILASLATAIYTTLSGNPTFQQYRLGLAFLCFALTSIAGLLFASRASINGTLGLLSISIAGPAATWLIALVVITHLFPEKSALAAFPDTIQSLSKLVQDVERRDGWQPFHEWKNSLNGLHELFEDEYEEGNVRLLLSGAYITGAGRHLPKRARLQTLFLYPSDTTADPSCTAPAIKLQRIQFDKDNGPAEVFVTASSTLPSGVASSYFLVRSGSRIKSIHSSKSPSWVKVADKPVDALIVARYCGEGLADGDWMQVHVPKYIADGGSADVAVGLVSERPLADIRFWEMARLSAVEEGHVPVGFRAASSNQGAAEDLIEDMSGWLKVIKESLVAPQSNALKNWPEAPELLSYVLNQTERLTKADPAIQRVAHRSEDMHSVAVITFTWRH